MDRLALIIQGQVKNYGPAQHKYFTENILTPLKADYIVEPYLVTSRHSVWVDQSAQHLLPGYTPIDVDSINEFFDFKEIYYDDSSEPSEERTIVSKALLSKLGSDWNTKLCHLYSMEFFYRKFLDKFDDYSAFLFVSADRLPVSELKLPPRAGSFIRTIFTESTIATGVTNPMSTHLAFMYSAFVAKKFCTRYSSLLDFEPTNYASYTHDYLRGLGILCKELAIHTRKILSDNSILSRDRQNIDSHIRLDDNAEFGYDTNHIPLNETMIFEDIKDIVNFRYAPQKYLRGKDWRQEYPGEVDPGDLEYKPRVFNYFTLILNRGEVYRRPTLLSCPDHEMHVLASPWDCKYLARRKDDLLLSNTNGVLVVAGDDVHLSENLSYLVELRDFFSKIYYEAKDIACDFVKALPMGHIHAYMLRTGGNGILRYVNHKDHTSLKTKLAATGFGSKWPGLTDKIEDRVSLQNFLESSDFVDNIDCHPQEYYEQVVPYKYFLCPIGNGIQTPKLLEALLVGTIPVVTKHTAYDDLKDWGLPLLVVDKWEDLTVEYLDSNYHTLYNQVDWDFVRRLYSVRHFKQNYLDSAT